MNELEQKELARHRLYAQLVEIVDKYINVEDVDSMLEELIDMAQSVATNTAIRTLEEAGRDVFKWWYDEGPQWLRDWSNGGMDGFEYTKRFGIMSPGAPCIAAGIMEHLDAKAAALKNASRTESEGFSKSASYS